MTWPSLRQEVISMVRTKHPRWIDANGLDQAATLHPVYSVARELLASAERFISMAEDRDDPRIDMISPEWRGLDGCQLGLGCECQVAYKIADTIGDKPSRYHALRTVHHLDAKFGLSCWFRGSIHAA